MHVLEFDEIKAIVRENGACPPLIGEHDKADFRPNIGPYGSGRESREAKAVKIVFHHEGGDNKDSILADKGGRTNMGISLRYIRNAGHDIDGDGDIDADDIAALTTDKAAAIYINDFWKANRTNEIVNDAIAFKKFDMDVNMGPRQPGKILQASLNEVAGVGLTVDGIVGSGTIGAVNAFVSSHDDPDTIPLLDAICDRQACFYDAIVAKDDTQGIYHRGWLNRAAWTPLGPMDISDRHDTTI